MVEYEACTMGIMMALEHQVKKLKVFGDLALVIYQQRGEWETRDTKLIPYHNHMKEIIESFDKVTFHHVPQEENQMANALATLSAMVQVPRKRGISRRGIRKQQKNAKKASIWLLSKRNDTVQKKHRNDITLVCRLLRG
ncbi:hypothetical protein CR513_02662, partial [Mucuna pruriens]